MGKISLLKTQQGLLPPRNPSLPQNRKQGKALFPSSPLSRSTAGDHRSPLAIFRHQDRTHVTASSGMALFASSIPSEVGLRLLLCPLGSNIVTRTACCAIGIGLPVYSTFKAIENKNQNEQEKWLLYWAVYGSFTMVEVFSDRLLSWCPFYYHIKFAFLVWLQLPSGQGSKQLYARHMRPFLLKHQARVDQLLNYLSREIESFVSNHQGEIQLVKTVAIRCAATANQLVKVITDPAHPNGQSTIAGPNERISQQVRDDSGSDADSDTPNGVHGI